MLYRYELYVDDEYQGVGFMEELQDIFSYDRASDLSFYFDYYLNIPAYYAFQERRTCAFFTELGNKKFQPYIQNIIKAYEEETIYEVKCIQMNESEVADDVLYSDEDQVIVRECLVHPNLPDETVKTTVIIS